MTIDDDHFTFEPDTARLQPVITQLQEVKLQDHLHPDGSLSINTRCRCSKGAWWRR